MKTVKRTKNKYGSKKVFTQGHKFDSQAEAKYFLYLLSKQIKGEIKEIELQPVLNIHPKFKNAKGETRRKMDYILDFKVTYANDEVEYIDVKGMATETAKVKRKLVEWLYPEITVTWISSSVKWGNEHGWIDFDELQRMRRKNKR